MVSALKQSWRRLIKSIFILGSSYKKNIQPLIKRKKNSFDHTCRAVGAPVHHKPPTSQGAGVAGGMPTHDYASFASTSCRSTALINHLHLHVFAPALGMA
jgi:hypothetical protein